MKIGINTMLFHSPFSNQNFNIFRKFKEWGYNGVEIPLENKGDFDYKKALYAFKENNLFCTSICAVLGSNRDLRGTKEKQENSLEHIKDCIDACTELEAKIVMGPFYSSVGRANMEIEQDKKEQWKVVVKNLKEICEYALEKDIVLAIEPLNRFETDFINTFSQARKMIEDVDKSNLFVVLDTFHMNIEEKSIKKTILEAKKFLYHFHASENDRGAPGSGHIPWNDIAEAFKSINYSGYIVVESFTPVVKVIAKAASIWRDIEESNEILAINGVKFLKNLFS